jgi:hypothetical protein
MHESKILRLVGGREFGNERARREAQWKGSRERRVGREEHRSKYEEISVSQKLRGIGWSLPEGTGEGGAKSKRMVVGWKCVGCGGKLRGWEKKVGGGG